MYHKRDTVQVDLLSKLSAHCPLSLRGRMAELLSFRDGFEGLESNDSMLIETSKRTRGAYPVAAQLPKSPKTKAFEGVVMYYGYRFYEPETGRWPSRDPIEEDGGINLYAFVANDGVNRWDLLGQSWNLDFTQNLQIGGCMPTPIPSVFFCVTGGYTATIDGCCDSDSGKKKRVITASGDINFSAAVGVTKGLTFSYTKGSNVITSYDNDCPEESTGFGGSVFLGFNAGVFNGQCTLSIPSGSISCSASAQLIPQGLNVYGGGSVNVNVTKVEDL